MPSLRDQKLQEMDRYICSGKKQIFTVGHNSQVVSFYSQQCRAFHLATLLRDTIPKSEHEAHEIAVVGAGIAGVTLWTTLRQYGFLNATLFEATNRILSRQSESSHRHAHPAINEWPLLGGGRPFSSTTKWPFLNWFGTDAKSVVEQLRADPMLTDHLTMARDHINFEHTVIDLKEVSDAIHKRHKVNARFKTPTKEKTLTFDKVIATLGYSSERDLDQSASKSYWWVDHVKHYVRDRHDFADHRVFVSGTGDGGLIDLIRFSTKESDLNSENTALEVVAHARRDEFRKLDNEWPNTLEIESDFEKGLKEELEAKEIDEDKITTYFSDLFNEKTFNDRFVTDNDLKRITLVSRNGQYVSDKSSFVNQVLTAYLKSRHKDLILEGSVKAGYIYKKGSKTKYCQQKNMNGGELHSIRVLRHGAPPRLDAILGMPSLLADQLNSDGVIFDTSDQLTDLRAGLDLLTNSNVADHIDKLIDEYLKTFFDCATARWSISEDSGEPEIVVSLPHNDYNSQGYRRLGGFDSELFGVPITYTDVEPLQYEEETFVVG